MIQIFTQCSIPYSHGTIIHGSTGNTVLPDPLLGSVDFQGTKVLLNKTIGDDLYIPSDGIQPMINMFKAFDLLGDILYEYSLFRVIVPNADEPFFIPISVKRYDTTMPYTFLFTRGVTLALDTLRGVRDYSIISATSLMKSFTGTAITFVDTMFSIELPSLMETVLSELGTYAYYDPTNADITMRNVFEELSRAYDQLVAYDCPKDIISYYGCKEDNIVPLSVIQNNTDSCTNGFYEPFAQELREKLKERTWKLIPLDIKQELFYNLMIQNILSELYQAPYTDISMVVDISGAKNVHIQKLFGIQPIEQNIAWSRLSPDTTIATYLHDGLVYHNQRHTTHIASIVFCKTWIDDLHIDVYMDDGSCYNFYLNMSLYHLYSPSIVRLHRQAM